MLDILRKKILQIMCSIVNWKNAASVVKKGTTKYLWEDHYGLVENESDYESLNLFWTRLESRFEEIETNYINQQIAFAFLKSRNEGCNLDHSSMEKLENVDKEIKQMLKDFTNEVSEIKSGNDLSVFPSIDQTLILINKVLNEFHTVASELVYKMWIHDIRDKIFSAAESRRVHKEGEVSDNVDVTINGEIFNETYTLKTALVLNEVDIENINK